MLQCSHHTFNSVFLIPVFSTFVMAVRPRSSRRVAFESVQWPRWCNPPGGDIQPARRSAQVFEEEQTHFLGHSDPRRRVSVIGTCDTALRDTMSRQLSTTG